jgi:hypothetical protein
VPFAVPLTSAEKFLFPVSLSFMGSIANIVSMELKKREMAKLKAVSDAAAHSLGGGI